MGFKTVTKVYLAGNPLSKIQELFPETWVFLEAQAIAFVAHKPDEFDTAVKAKTGSMGFDFRLTHRDDLDRLTQDLSELLGDVTSRLLLEKHFSGILGRCINALNASYAGFWVNCFHAVGGGVKNSYDPAAIPSFAVNTMSNETEIRSPSISLGVTA